MSYVVRPADPADAQGLSVLGDAVAAEPEGWLATNNGWRTVGDERRYLRAIRRYPHAGVFVAEAEDGSIVGRLSLARDQHPASRHVADGCAVPDNRPFLDNRHVPDNRPVPDEPSVANACTAERRAAHDRTAWQPPSSIQVRTNKGRLGDSAHAMTNKVAAPPPVTKSGRGS